MCLRLLSSKRDTFLTLWHPRYDPGIHSAPPSLHPLNSWPVNLTGKSSPHRGVPEASCFLSFSSPYNLEGFRCRAHLEPILPTETLFAIYSCLKKAGKISSFSLLYPIFTSFIPSHTDTHYLKYSWFNFTLQQPIPESSIHQLGCVYSRSHHLTFRKLERILIILQIVLCGFYFHVANQLFQTWSPWSLYPPSSFLPHTSASYI